MPVKEDSIAAIICAAGSSIRMGGVKKEYLLLEPFPSGGEKLTVLGAAFSAFASCPKIGLIIIAVPPGSKDGENAARACLPPEHRLSKNSAGDKQERILFVPGGSTRRASVYNALKQLEQYHPSHVLIHDGARPWIKKSLIEKVINTTIRYGAAIPVLPMSETPKELEIELKTELPSEMIKQNLSSKEIPVFIKHHLRRRTIYIAQTPQGFKFPEMLEAHKKAAEREARENFKYTDDAEVWGEFIGQVAVVPGDPENKKITFPGDLIKPVQK